MRFCRIFASIAAFTLTAAVLLTVPDDAIAAPPYAAAPDGVTIERDVAFLAADRTEKLDLYLPATRAAGARSPAVVIIHGGGWSGGSKSAGREFNIGTTLAKAGYVCASIEYRLEKKDRWPTNVWDCKNAVRFLRKNATKYGIDTDHIGVIGGSAGGHLALMVGVTGTVKELEPPTPYPGVSDKVQAVVDMYGISDVRTGKKTDARGNPTDEHKSWDAVFGDHTPITEADRALASPNTHLAPGIPPILILQGTADTTVDRDQSINLDRRLTALKLEHQLILVPGIGHTFDLETWNRKPLPMDLRPVVTAFFDRHLKPASGAKQAKP
jgi:acetyl esterase/lipase